MTSKIDKRHRRAQHIRRAYRGQDTSRLCIHRTPRHIYAQIIDDSGARTLVSASTLEVEIRKQLKNGGNIEAAKLIGKRIAEKAKVAGIAKVSFDRSGFKYHGRVKALADSARENGLQF